MEASKVVVDTNVIIAGAINPYGSSGKILNLVAKHAVISFTSSTLLEELEFKLYHKKVLNILGIGSMPRSCSGCSGMRQTLYSHRGNLT